MSNNKKIACLDVETTGLSPWFDEILQLSIINETGETLFNEYIRPKENTSWPDAEMIHGISPKMVEKCLTIDEYIPKINQILAEADLIVGYNSDSFDLSFLMHAGIKIPKDTPTFDVMLEFAPIYGEWNSHHQNYKWQKLSTCAAFYGYEGTGEFHDSLEDVRATLFCYFAMTEEKQTVSTLNDVNGL